VRRIDEWERVPVGAGFGSDEESPAVVAAGTGRITRALGAGPWRARVWLSTEDGGDAGARLELESGHALALTVQRLTGYLVSVGTVPPGAEGARSERRLASTMVSAAEDVPLVVELVGRRARFFAGAKPVTEVPLEEPGAGFSLYVARSTGSRFRDATLERAVGE
jgi:hypothetical protein